MYGSSKSYGALVQTHVSTSVLEPRPKLTPRVKMLITLRTCAGMVTSYTCHTTRGTVRSVTERLGPRWCDPNAAYLVDLSDDLIEAQK